MKGSVLEDIENKDESRPIEINTINTEERTESIAVGAAESDDSNDDKVRNCIYVHYN